MTRERDSIRDSVDVGWRLALGRGLSFFLGTNATGDQSAPDELYYANVESAGGHGDFKNYDTDDPPLCFSESIQKLPSISLQFSQGFLFVRL